MSHTSGAETPTHIPAIPERLVIFCPSRDALGGIFQFFARHSGGNAKTAKWIDPRVAHRYRRRVSIPVGGRSPGAFDRVQTGAGEIEKNLRGDPTTSLAVAGGHAHDLSLGRLLVAPQQWDRIGGAH